MDEGRLVKSVVPERRALSKGVKLSEPSMSSSGAIVKGVPSGCDRCALFLEVSTFSISSGLFIYRH